MKTREQYMNDECTHKEYYGQFVTDSVLNRVRNRIGLDRLKASTDEHINDIPLMEWDMCGLPADASRLLVMAGDYHTLAGQTCILKEAARMLLTRT